MNSGAVPDEGLTTQQSVVDYKKKQKQRNVLAHLYSDGKCTLAQLTQVVHSSIPSVTSLVDELVDDQWVTPTGTAIGSNGRRPALFDLNPGRNYVAVLDVSTHDTKILFMNTHRKLVFRGDYDLRLVDNPILLSSLVNYFNDALAKSGLAASDLIAIGISMPGLIDSRRGINLTYKNIHQSDESLTQWFSAQTGKPVYLINDTKATVLGESRFGGAKGKKQVLTINIDWGVGLGIIVNGDVFQGASGFAGELGHIQVDPNGELCHCGKIGCLNTLTSASSLVQRAQRDILAGKASKLAIFQKNVEQIDIDELINAANQGDVYSIKTLHDAGFQLGKGLAIAVSLFNPEIIIVDGVLAKASTFLLNTIRQAIVQYCLSDFHRDLRIELTQLDDTAKWLGTHAYVMEDIFANFGGNA
ncbi:ROK family transcriptional regulator [Spirosoma harenae]